MISPTLRRLLVAASVLLALVTTSRAEDVEFVNLGDTVSGSTENGVKEVLPFHAVAGSVIDIDLKMAPGSFPGVVIVQPDRTEIIGLAAYGSLDSKNSRLKLKKVPLEQSGRHYLLVRPTVNGSYSLKIKGKPLTKGASTGTILLNPPTEIVFGAVPGALLTVSVKRAAKSGLAPEIVFLRDPADGNVDLGAAVKHVINEKVDSYKSIPLGLLGPYTLGVATQGDTPGDVGSVKWSVKFPRVKGARRDAAEVIVDPLVDSTDPETGFDNLAYGGITISGDFFGLSPTVSLQGPGGTIPGTSVVRDSDTRIRFAADLIGRAVGDYDVVVSYTNGAEGRAVGAFAVSATPIPEAMGPATGFDNQNLPVTLTGSRFLPGMSVLLAPVAGGSNITAVVGTVTPTTAALTLPLQDRALGFYDVIATNPDGGTNTLASGFRIHRAPRLLGATPNLGHDNQPALEVLLSGLSFDSSLTCNIEKTGEAPRIATVTFLSSIAARATFNLSGVPATSWTLRVTNPDGGTAVLGVPFVTTLAPRVLSANPNRGFVPDTLAGVIVNGSQFVPGAQANLERGGIPTVLATGEAVSNGGTIITTSLPLAAAAGGLHDLRVTNPDGGTELLPDGFSVLGTSPLASGFSSGGASALFYNPDRAEYFAVWAVNRGSHRDLQCRRFDPVSGQPLNDVVDITTGVQDQFDPSVAWSASLGRYMVVYSWSDPDAPGNQTRVFGQFVMGDGALGTAEENAIPIFNASSGVLSPARIAWNGDQEEWMIVWAWDTNSQSDVYYQVFDKGIFFDDVLVPFSVSQGTLIANTHTESSPEGTVTVGDPDRQPDVVFSPTVKEYIVAYTFENGSASDVRAVIYDGDFSSGPVVEASLSTLANEASAEESFPRVAFDPVSGNYMLAWTYVSADGDRDVRCRLIDATTREAVGTGFTLVEQTEADDCRTPSLGFDATNGNRNWLVAYARGNGGTGTSSIQLARLPVVGTGSGLGTPAYLNPAATLAFAAYTAPAVAARAVGGEILVSWTFAGLAKPGVNLETRFMK